MRHLLVCIMLGAFSASGLTFAMPQAEAAQTSVKKKKEKTGEKKEEHQLGKKKYPWGEPNAGWDDRCVFFYDTYDGWIPPYCRPHGRTY